MKTSSLLIIASLLCSVLLFSFDIQKAYAFGITRITNAQITGLTCPDATISGNFLWIVCSSNNTAYIYTSAGVFLTSYAGVAFGGSRVFPYQSGIITEDSNRVVRLDYNPVGGVIQQTFSLQGSGCTSLVVDSLKTINGHANVICPLTDEVHIFDMDTGAQITDSGSLNAGAAPCDQPNGFNTDINSLFAMVSCIATGDKVVLYVMDASFQFDSTDQSASVVLTSPADLAIDEVRNRVFITRASDTARVYNYTSTTFTLDRDSLCGAGSDEAYYYSATIVGDIYVCDDSAENVYVYNADNEFNMISISLASETTDVSLFGGDETGSGDNLLYAGSGQAGSEEYFEMDLTGLTGGTESGQPPSGGGGIIGGIDCNLPENANILICRLGADDLGGIGNSTGTGLLNLACNVVFVTCNDTNPRTNGLGLLAFIASLFVIVGMFWYAIGKEAFHMPLFIWIVIVVALSAFFTITGLIDPIFLVLTIVAIIAMAVPKIVSITRGSSTMGTGSSA